ncbi:MAG: RNA methyltransferase [Verrucomicrobiales bacterium]|nr:RNA methyltransferase [Verrucomicrobiales bacterium]
MTVDEELVEFLRQYITENKQDKIAAAVKERTRHVTIMLEEIYQPHNASACLRNCDCLGIQDVHIVENRNRYRPNNNVSMGSSKWLTMHRYHQTSSALETLRAKGYRIVATTPNYEGYDPVTLPLDQPVALLFGTEEEGLTSEAIEAADDYLCLPMYGFTQSYNISVTVALTLSRIVERLRDSDLDWRLSEEEKTKVTLEWYRGIVRRHELLEADYWEGNSSKESRVIP